MGIFAELGHELAAAAAAAPPIRVAVMDSNDGIEIAGCVTGELSETHVQLRCDDGLVFPVAKADLRFLGPVEAAS